jgi:shikimate dehydrogenase
VGNTPYIPYTHYRLNVTIPHKGAVIPLVDELTPAAEAIGAVNTIFQLDGRLIGDNTDAPGFWMDIVSRLNIQNLKPKNALILGAGGSARAVAYALVSQGFRVTIAARRVEQAENLCAHFSAHKDKFSAALLSGESLVESSWSLIVNTTPVGMAPHPNESPWPPEVQFPKGAALYDLVYNPPETLLVKQAWKAGLEAVSGLGMLIEQAALAFERWTGVEAPRDVMRGAVSG